MFVADKQSWCAGQEFKVSRRRWGLKPSFLPFQVMGLVSVLLIEKRQAGQSIYRRPNFALSSLDFPSQDSYYILCHRYCSPREKYCSIKS